MMEVIGNIESVKKAIEQRYQKEIKAKEKEVNQQIQQMKKQTEERIRLMKEKMEAEAEQEARKEHAKIISEQRLKAKREYEEKREQLINQVFQEVEKEKKKRAHSKAYIDWVKARMPSGKLTAVADSDYYRKHLKAENWKVDQSIAGVKFKCGNVIYDFTLDSALTSQKERLRNVVSQTLW